MTTSPPFVLFLNTLVNSYVRFWTIYPGTWTLFGTIEMNNLVKKLRFEGKCTHNAYARGMITVLNGTLLLDPSHSLPKYVAEWTKD